MATRFWLGTCTCISLLISLPSYSSRLSLFSVVILEPLLLYWQFANSVVYLCTFTGWWQIEGLECSKCSTNPSIDKPCQPIRLSVHSAPSEITASRWRGCESAERLGLNIRCRRVNRPWYWLDLTRFSWLLLVTGFGLVQLLGCILHNMATRPWLGMCTCI